MALILNSHGLISVSAGLVGRGVVAEYCGQLKKAEESLSRIRRFSKRAQLIFKILLLLTLVGLIVFIVSSFFSQGNLIEAPSPYTAWWISIIPPVMFLIVSAAILWFLEGIFGDITKGDSPFTKKQARRLKLISLLLLGNVIIDLIVQGFLFDYSYIIQVNPDIEVGYVDPGGQMSLHVDAKALLGAVACYCFAAMFSYGAYLQEVSDETV